MAQRFFSRNIDRKGRLLRGALAALLLISGGLLIQRQLWLGVFLMLSGVFVLFEAMSGWCAFRAFGIKTKF